MTQRRGLGSVNVSNLVVQWTQGFSSTTTPGGESCIDQHRTIDDANGNGDRGNSDWIEWSGSFVDRDDQLRGGNRGSG